MQDISAVLFGAINASLFLRSGKGQFVVERVVLVKICVWLPVTYLIRDKKYDLLLSYSILIFDVCIVWNTQFEHKYFQVKVAFSTYMMPASNDSVLFLILLGVQKC